LKRDKDMIPTVIYGAGTYGLITKHTVEKETSLDGKLAIIPSIQGWAKIYGYNTIFIDDEDDPYAHGFQVI